MNKSIQELKTYAKINNLKTNAQIKQSNITQKYIHELKVFLGIENIAKIKALLFLRAIIKLFNGILK
jgi:hypothetical protein